MLKHWLPLFYSAGNQSFTLLHRFTFDLFIITFKRSTRVEWLLNLHSNASNYVFLWKKGKECLTHKILKIINDSQNRFWISSRRRQWVVSVFSIVLYIFFSLHLLFFFVLLIIQLTFKSSRKYHYEHSFDIIHSFILI